MSPWEFFKSGFRNKAEPNFTCEPWSGSWKRFSGCLFIKMKKSNWCWELLRKKKNKSNLISACLINSTPWNCWVYRSTINVNSFTWLSLIASYAHTQNYLMEQLKSFPLPPKLSVKEKHESYILSSPSTGVGWRLRNTFSLPVKWVKVPQSCLTILQPHGLYIVHGILQARILEWVDFPFSRGCSQPRDQTQVSFIAGRFFTSWATREAQEYWHG